MSAIRVAGAILIALGLLAVLAGFVLGVAPEVVERTVTIPHTELLMDQKLSVGPLRYVSAEFKVPPEAKSIYLDLTIDVYEGNDIDLELYHEGSRILELRVRGSYSDTIALPGPGLYEIRFDNSYSIITTKGLLVRATLRWSELRVEKQEITRRSPGVMFGGLLLVVAGAVAYVVGGRGPRPETPEEVLLDLAGRRPSGAGGPQETIVVKVTPQTLDFRELPKLMDVVARARGVQVDAYKPRLRFTYTIRIVGPREEATKAAKDIVEYCERTKRCRVTLE